MMESVAANLTTAMAANLTGGLFNDSDASPAMLYHHCHPSSPDFNCTRDEYLVFNRGPQTLHLSIVLPVSIHEIFNNIKIS